jgi:FAD/FMN-containing dehydrogenase
MDYRFLTVVRRHDTRVDAMLPEQTDTALLIEFEGGNDEELDEKFAALTTTSMRRRRCDSFVRQPRLRPNICGRYANRRGSYAAHARSRANRYPSLKTSPFIQPSLPACVDFLQRLFDREGVDAVMVGHMGDGNLHTRPFWIPKTNDSRVVQRIYDEASAYVLSVRGTMSGEHGDGLVHTAPSERDVRRRNLQPLHSHQEGV